MDLKDMSQQEAEYAGFVDRGTQVVLQEAIKKIIEAFAQTDTLEDILGYLEETRENLQNSEERLKEIQKREKQITDKVGAAEISVRNLLQRIQSMEVQLANACESVEKMTTQITRLTQFFEKSPLQRMFSRLQPQHPTDLPEEEEEM